MPQGRRELRSDFTLFIDDPGGASSPPPWAGVPGLPLPSPEVSRPAGPATPLTRTLNAVWISDGDGEGGRPLDEALTNLGESYFENDRVVWEPPSDLSPEYAEYLNASLAQLNRLIDDGVVEVDSDGNIRPASQ